MVREQEDGHGWSHSRLSVPVLDRIAAPWPAQTPPFGASYRSPSRETLGLRRRLCSLLAKRRERLLAAGFHPSLERPPPLRHDRGSRAFHRISCSSAR